MQAIKEKPKSTNSKIKLKAVNAAVEIVAQSPSTLKTKTTKAPAELAP